MTRKRRLLNWVFYSIAAGFLLWHLLPVGAAIKDATYKPQLTAAELASTASCSSQDANFEVLTLGNPLTQPLTTNLARQESVLNWQSIVSENLVVNGDFVTTETSSAPGWQPDRYGDNTASLSVVTGASSSWKAGRVEITQYASGDSKWLMQPIESSENQLVNYSFRYRSNQTGDVVAAITDNDGDVRYLNLGRLVSTNGAWKLTRGQFVTPEHTRQLQVAFVLDQKGWIESGNYRVGTLPAPAFRRGIASVTFDDGWASIYTGGLPVFQKYNVPTTQFVVAGYDGKAYMTEAQIRAMQKAGQQIDSHSFSHQKMTVLGNEQLTKEIAGSKLILRQKYGAGNNLATPYGDYTDAVNQRIGLCYQSHRTTDTGFNAPGYDRYQVRVQNVEVNTKPEEIRAWADYAQKHNLWLVLVYHQVEDGGSYSVDGAILEAHMKALKDSGIHIATYADALVETYPQR